MDYEKVEAHLNKAIDSLFESDSHLLDADASERSISHRLAMYLADEFPSFDVDCEYNRDGFDIKRLGLAVYNCSGDAIDAVTVFPDIIIHKRGSNINNLLVIEIKKFCSKQSHDYDLEKLKAFREQLQYTYAIHLTIGKSTDGFLKRKLVRHVL